MQFVTRPLFVFCLLNLVTVLAEADVRLPRIFSDHMVLQRDHVVPVWGWADPGERVTVTFGGTTATAVTGSDGSWTVQLDRQPAGGPHRLQVQGENELIVEDVWLGEVWVCSGQSNMEWPVHRTEDADQVIAAGDYPMIRTIKSPHHTSTEPLDDLFGGEWQICSPQTVADFSAVAYFFGRKLQTKLEVPVGLINLSWGGTCCEAWTSREVLAADDAFAAILERTDAEQDNSTPHRGAVLFNSMIAPVIPYRIRGVIWYQGESNIDRAVQYAKLFPAMIADWRTRWKQGDFPFLFVQIAPFRYRGQHPQLCAELWDSQLQTLRAVGNTGMAVTTDIAMLRDIHPPNKKDVGRRLAAWALADTYSHQCIPSGPLYRSMKIDGDTIGLRFDYVGKGLCSSDGKPLSEFTVSSVDGHFLPTRATIEGDTVLVRCDAIAEPVAVRFAFYDSAQPNLVNSAGLPASPFRTDDFPLRTWGKE